MKIQPIKSFKFLGYNFTHKSQLLPKSMVNYYHETYCPYAKRTLLKKMPFYIQKFINKLFPDYLVETNHQHRWRTNYSCFELDSYKSFYEDLKSNRLKDVKLTQDEIKELEQSWWDDIVKILRQAYDEGRLGKPKQY